MCAAEHCPQPHLPGERRDTGVSASECLSGPSSFCVREEGMWGGGVNLWEHRSGQRTSSIASLQALSTSSETEPLVGLGLTK